jgi:hypothetical protein
MKHFQYLKQEKHPRKYRLVNKIGKVRLPKHCHYGRATVDSLCIDALQITGNNVTVFFLGIEMQKNIFCTAVELQNISYRCQKYQGI